MDTKKLLVLVLSWLLPGSGYWFVQQRLKSGILFLLIVPTYFLGICMLDFSTYFLHKHRFYYVLNFVIGLPGILFVNFATSTPQLVSSPDVIQLGFLCIAVSSLLNILLFSKIYFTLSKVSR
ncbi:DUF6677 family protein [Candidatus Uabimicrobium amorphum]|uniref:DUF6677 domain-containing protein n=1 Tax=Uabimicrobium amorphum TaxID=2596890 RepID=A0A5S9ITH7_UABAM|nr:DUF6677 family protein [Candidatus Uabimicrobium amorphum]BBM87644.1 hypothetical protein UABAM_06056 [Candidatus Uabimicrobium amorphum]